MIRDAGRTQIAPGSLTALAVGPGKSWFIQHVEIRGPLSLRLWVSAPACLVMWI